MFHKLKKTRQMGKWGRGVKSEEGQNQKSNMRSGSAFVGYSGMLLNKNEIVLKNVIAKGANISGMRHVSKTLKMGSKFGRRLGYLGIGLTLLEDFNSNEGLTWGTGAKVVLGGGMLFLSAPVSLGIAGVDVGYGLATGTTIIDNIANYVNEKAR